MICFNIFASVNTCTPFNAMYLAYYLYFMPTSFVLKIFYLNVTNIGCFHL